MTRDVIVPYWLTLVHVGLPSLCVKGLLEAEIKHCVKSVQTQSFFWSVFSRNRTEYGEIRSI